MVKKNRTPLSSRSAHPDEADLLSEVAAASRLAEGREGVRRLLRSILRRGPVPVRELARDLGIPVPVVAAVRGELEKRGLLARGSGIDLTEAGLLFVEEHAGLRCRRRFDLFEATTLPADLAPAIERLNAIAPRRPPVNVTLDQSHATTETAIRRGLYLYEHDAVEGRRILLIGDDDLTSLAIALSAEVAELGRPEIIVLDVDNRLVAFLNKEASKEGLPVEAIHHDLRAPIPPALEGGFDTFFTDPPYTLNGLSLFVSRGLEGLSEDGGAGAFVCFGRRAPTDTAAAIGLLAGSGLAPMEIVPTFNEYVGAQLLAGQSQMIRCSYAGGGERPVTGAFDGPLYTADFRKGRHPA